MIGETTLLKNYLDTILTSILICTSEIIAIHLSTGNIDTLIIVWKCPFAIDYARHSYEKCVRIASL